METEEQRQNKERMRRESGRILKRIREAAPAVLARFPVEIAYVYGSVARGTVLDTSDADVALLLSDGAPTDAYQRLKLELEIQAALEDASGFNPVDARSINHAPIMVQGAVVTEGELVYERDKERRVAFEVATRQRYFDFAPHARRYDQLYLDRIRRKGFLHDKT